MRLPYVYPIVDVSTVVCHIQCHMCARESCLSNYTERLSVPRRTVYMCTAPALDTGTGTGTPPHGSGTHYATVRYEYCLLTGLQ